MTLADSRHLLTKPNSSSLHRLKKNSIFAVTVEGLKGEGFKMFFMLYIVSVSVSIIIRGITHLLTCPSPLQRAHTVYLYLQLWPGGVLELSNTYSAVPLSTQQLFTRREKNSKLNLELTY